MSLMSNIGWFASNCRKSEIDGKSVLDVGSNKPLVYKFDDLEIFSIKHNARVRS